MGDLFHRFSTRVSNLAGSSSAFILAAAIIVVWAVSGPFFGFSNTWQLVINTGTTIVTFLMVFLIQNTQNRDAVSLHLKLDELIRATQGARNVLLDIEERSDDEVRVLRAHYASLADRARADVDRGLADTGARE